MDNIFKILDEDSDAEPVSIQEKVKEAKTITRSGIDKSEIPIKSKAIVGKKSRMLRKGKDRDNMIENKYLKKQKKNSLRQKAKHSY
ncbi:unnamed protein product [Blepharisma stoltei]|uniref:Uncharacterized protein n=1 Tax=Blepharisma stoltei TaxID=1481888 RepID=A0AAU9KE65_9CILI|nr:unnamed protein product [Blepharisma stoltei]